MTISTLLRRGMPAAVLVFVLAAAAAPASVRTSLSGWFWGNPSPQGSALSAVDFLGARGYAIGADGTTLRSDDAGATWSGLATGTNASLTRLQIIDADSIVVLGGDGCVLRRSDDSGSTFQRLFTVTESGCPDHVVAFWFTDESTGFLVLKDGSVLKTTDKGQSFSKQTAVPGTAASATGGNGQVADVVFPVAGRGIVFVTPQGSPTSSAYQTTDDGISWKPLTLPAGNVTRVYRYDATTLWTTGAGTLLRSTDGGVTFETRDVGTGRTLTGIRCSSATDCLLTTDKGELLRTTDGGATVTTITAASVPLASAAYASPAQAVAVGAAGQMVVSADAGLNWSPVGGDLGGSFSRLRIGSSPTAVYAAGTKGVVGISVDGGATWKGVSVATSADIADTSWSSTSAGYALDVRGSLFRTSNAGASWQTLSTGPGGTPHAVLALPDGRTVLLIGPRGLRRSLGGGAFNAVSGKPVGGASLTDAQRAGSAIVAWSTRKLLVSTTSGSSWKALKLPTKSTSIDDLSFQSAKSGWLLSSDGSLWRTTNGRTWTESLATGTNQMFHIAFGSTTSGFVAVDGLGTDSDSAYVLRTSDGGATWRPQAIGTGSVDALIAGDASHAYSLIGQPTQNSERWLFATATGGDAGSVPALKIGAKPASFTKKSLKKAKYKVTITGTLQGAEGGEQVTIAVRPRSDGSWRSQTVTVGANGGSFSAVFTVKRPSVAVAQWRGDSGRRGVGTPALAIKVK